MPRGLLATIAGYRVTATRRHKARPPVDQLSTHWCPLRSGIRAAGKRLLN